MTKLMRWGRSGLLIIAGVLVGALTLGTTYAISTGPSTAPSPATSKYGYVGLSPMAFAPLSSDEISRGYWTRWDPTTIVPDSRGCYNTGLTMPGGVKLQRVAMWFEGLGAGGGNYTGVVIRSDPATQTSQRIGSRVVASSDGMHRVVVSIPKRFRAVQNDKWMYGVGFCAEDGMTFHGARAVYKH